MKLNKNQIRKFKKINKSEYIDILNESDFTVIKSVLHYDGEDFLESDNWRVALMRYVGAGIKPKEYNEPIIEKYGIKASSLKTVRSEIGRAIKSATPYTLRKPFDYGVRGSPATELSRHIKEMAALDKKAGFKVAETAKAQSVVFSEEDKVYLRKDKPFMFEDEIYKEPELGRPDPLLRQSKERSDAQKRQAKNQTLIDYVEQTKTVKKSKTEKEIEAAYAARRK